MFEHSVRVPRLYKTAVNILKQVKNDGASLKGLILERKFENIKALYALISETMRRQSDINYLFKKTQLLEKEPRLDPWLASILICELLWGKGTLLGECKPIKTILSYKQTLLAHSTELNGKSQTEVEKPRYVRVNTLKLSVTEAINGFIDEGWFLSKLTDALDYEAFLEKLANLEESEFMVDFHIKDLLIFPKKTRFYRHNAFLDSSIILQDKASCLPARILNPPPGSIVLDMCAAPGMKTTQLAAIMEDKGTIFAVERQLKRFETLKTLVNKSGATCVKTLHKDVLSVTNEDLPGVEYILVDPSCSGSGMVDIVELEVHNLSPERIQQLARFQIIILKHALRNFPKCKRVVYSTCSIQPEENEEVVKEAISSNRYFKLVSAHEHLDAPWLHFGSSKYGDLGKLCLYAKSEVDKTNGFFVAVFERLEDGEVNQFYNISNTYDPTFKHTKKRNNNYNNRQMEYNGEENYGSEEISEMKNAEICKDNEEEIVGGGSKENTEMIRSKKCKRKKKKEVNNEGFDVYVESGKRVAEADDEVVTGKTKKKLNTTDVGSEKKDVLKADGEDMVVNVKMKKKQNSTDVGSQMKNVLEADDEDVVVAVKMKKRKKQNSTYVENEMKNVLEADGEDMVVAVKMKKKKKQNTTDVEIEMKNVLEADAEDMVVAVKMKKKRNSTDVRSEKKSVLKADEEEVVVAGKTKKKRKQNSTDIENEMKNVLEADGEDAVVVVTTKKRKKEKEIIVDVASEVCKEDREGHDVPKKKKKKKSKD